MASSTALSCFNNSSLRDDVLLRGAFDDLADDAEAADFEGLFAIFEGGAPESIGDDAGLFFPVGALGLAFTANLK